LIIILGVGHNAKARTIAYIPLVIAGVLLVFRKHSGGLLTMFALAALMRIIFHYYLLIFLLILSVYFVTRN
jgi:hypothetical protein